MSDRHKDREMLHRLLCSPREPDQTEATPPSLAPWLGYALLGLLTMTGLAATMLALVQIG